MGIEKVYSIRSKVRLEVPLARRMMGIAPSYVEGFGASDTDLASHLFYFGEQKPWSRREFLDALFDFQMDRSLTL